MHTIGEHAVLSPSLCPIKGLAHSRYLSKEWISLSLHSSQNQWMNRQRCLLDLRALFTTRGGIRLVKTFFFSRGTSLLHWYLNIFLYTADTCEAKTLVHQDPFTPAMFVHGTNTDWTCYLLDTKLPSTESYVPALSLQSGGGDRHTCKINK